ncbi:hypothetical protein C6P40_002777 [Pichia californica]|uniref:FAD-binding FR-type domain-containing protein n=1 Tax=Pichia californica TaxID=460514 RepID=A0A9P7BEK0_9ASCO|nr:hypothetical protein C6P40_002777 [[Candida] californica]
MQLSSLIQIIVFATTATADKQWYHYNNDYYAVSGCKSALTKGATFGTGKAAKLMCTNKNALGSLLYCSYNATHVNNKDINSLISSSCELYSNKTSNEYYESIYQYTLENIIDVSNNKSFNASEPISFPVTSKKLYNSAYNYRMTLRNRFGNVKTSHILGICFAVVTCFILLINGLINWTMRLSKGVSNNLDNKFTKNFRKFMNLKIFRNHLQPTIMGFNPDAVETFWISIMFLYSILSCCIIGHRWDPNDTSFKTYQAGTSRYWGDRSCILLSYQLPFLFLFPGRNNFFQWITRWKYSRFVTFHKWLARIIMLEVLIHSFAMASQTYALSKYTRFATEWYRAGITATVAGCLICVLASYFIRRHWYEFFFFTHIILVVMFLWTAWIHTKSQSYEDFYWTCIAIWIFDRFLRLCRILVNGINDATIEYFPGNDDIIKIHVLKSKLYKNFQPGSHAFIYFLSKNTFWQNHPFTVFESIDDSNKITFCCRVKKGVTKTIANKFNNENENDNIKSINMKILIEGFYGEQSYYQQYDKAVFITGNTGISGPFAHIKKLSASNSNIQLQLYWGIRSYNTLKWFKKELLSLKNTNCIPKIFISQPEKGNFGFSSSSASDSDQKVDNDDVASEKKFELDNENDADIHELLEFVEIIHGRMPISEIIDNELKDFTGNVAFGACAHTEVVDTARREVAKRLTSYDNRIDYFEEMQAW